MYLGGRRLAEERGTNSAPGVTLLGAEGAHDLCETSALCADTGTSEQNACRLPCSPLFSFTLKTKTHPRRQERLRRCFPWRARTAQTLRTSVFPRAPGGRVLSGDDVAGHKRASARQVTALATPVVALTYRPQTVHRRRSLFIKAAPEGAGLSRPSSFAGGAVGRRPPRRPPPMAPRGFRSLPPGGPAAPACRAGPAAVSDPRQAPCVRVAGAALRITQTKSHVQVTIQKVCLRN